MVLIFYSIVFLFAWLLRKQFFTPVKPFYNEVVFLWLLLEFWLSLVISYNLRICMGVVFVVILLLALVFLACLDLWLAI